MEFKEVEKKVDSFVLDYIKDVTTESVYSHTEIKKVRETENGTTYSSIYVYKRVLDEEKYMRLVREHYINNVQSKSDKKTKKTTKRKKKELGKNVTQEEFLRTIFRDNFEHRKGQKDKKGRRINMNSVLANIDPELRVINGKAVSNSFEKMLKKSRKYGYFTPNMFIAYNSFAKELLTLLGVIILDFDLDKVGQVMTKEELFKYIKKKIKVEPTMIWDTKTSGNYQAAILLKPMAATPKSVHFYEQIVKEMIYKLGEGCDLSCYNANHLFSMGQNNKHKKKFTRKYNENIHDIDEFRWLLRERDERREKEGNNSNLVDFTKESVKRHPAIVALSAGEVSWRNHACFTLALVRRFLGYKEEETENYIISTWVPSVQGSGDHPFTNHEAYQCIRSAYSGKYRNFHSKWVTVVTGLECELKGYFKGYSPYISQGIYVTDTETRFKEFLRKNGGSFVGTIPQLMELLGVKRTTLENVLYKMRDSGELDYRSTRGCYSKSTFVLIEKKEQPVIAFESFKNYEEVYKDINELEEVVNEIRGAN